MTDLAAPATATVSRARARALRAPALGLATSALAVGWLHRTDGYAVLPGGLLSCPLHAATGLWCPFCGGLRCVAALTRGDLFAALSLNVVVVALLPVLVAWWCLTARAALAGRPGGAPRVSNRFWLGLGLVLVAFTVWRNLPQLAGGTWLAP